MKLALPVFAAALAGATLATAQSQPNEKSTIKGAVAPIYQVTVVERGISAVNYKYRSIPTPIDFRGTVLMPQAKGLAMVESRKGRTDIDVHVHHLSLPQQYGREYLTYVLWAITPEGRPNNLGEIVPDGGNDGHLHVTTDLQAFAMLVTAEPYSAVRQPSDVVVMENQIRKDTHGTLETVNAKYELLPRGTYTWNTADNHNAELANLPKVTQDDYELLTELYQAQNAIGIAKAAGAEQFAPETLTRAEQLLSEAQEQHKKHASYNKIIGIARQSAEIAEDARLLAADRKEEASVIAAQAQVAQMRQQTAAIQLEAAQARAQADEAVRQAKIQADAAVQHANALEQQAQADRAAAAAAEARAQQTAAVQQQAQSAQVQVQRGPTRAEASESALRGRLLQNLNGIIVASDTPRGLVVMLPDSDFIGNDVRGPVAEKLSRVCSLLSQYPNLTVRVEGYSDDAGQRAASEDRAEAVRHIMQNRGLKNRISSEGLGDSRPIGPPGIENTRVEIVISGSSIGTVPTWEQTSSLGD